MSEEKPSPVTYHEYNIPSLNSLFAWSAALLLLVSLWMIWADYERDWKGYQRRFTNADIARTRTAIAASDKAIDAKALAAAKAAVASAEKTLAASKTEQDRAQGELAALEGTWYNADQQFKFKKAELDVARYVLDEALLHKHDEAGARANFKKVNDAVEEWRLKFEDIDAKKKVIDATIAGLNRERIEAEKEIARLRENSIRLERKLASIDHSLFNDWFRNQPLVDFLAPSIVVKQVILPEVHEDVNFMTVPRVDRCHSCHLGIDKPGYDDKKLEPVFRSHPRPDVLLGRNHPIERFGCTACHAGSGRSLTFKDVTHTPSPRKDAKGKAMTADEVAREWEHKFGWGEVHHWDFPMLPIEYSEANCASCHSEETRIPGADKLNMGREIMEEYGCWGCHKIDRPGYDELREVGPSLANLQGKVTREWTANWLRNPRSFRPSTRMPRFWGNENTATATSAMNWPLRDEIESEAVTRYILEHSKPYDKVEKPSGTGDATRGKWVVENRGCKACHVVGEGDTGDNRYNANFGPSLNEVGSKLTVDWLYAWVKNPKAMWAGTRMPDLRLTDQEALDAATWLATLKNKEFEAIQAFDAAAPDALKMLEGITYEYLRKETTTADADARLKAMAEGARWDYVGKKLVNRYGCFGCHEGIGGFEDAQRIGTELTTWASKLLTQLDFGLVKMPHTKHDWLKGKLGNTRLYDRGKVDAKDPQDLLKMPNFAFTPEQIEAVATAVLGLQTDLVQPQAKRSLDFAQTKVEKGRRIYRQFNCQGCHVIDNLGGGMEKVLEGGKPFAPPVLVADYKMPDGRTGHTQEGAKVQPEWLFSFLQEPETIRPWLNVRMPSFALDDAQSTALVEYFSFQAKQAYPYQTHDASKVTASLLGDGEALFKKYSCVSCHIPLEQAMAAAGKNAKLADVASSLAPNLELTKTRLKYDWLYEWLKDPAVMQKDTKMPSGFFYVWNEETKAYDKVAADADRQIDSLRGYLHYHERPIYETGTVAATARKR